MSFSFTFDGRPARGATHDAFTPILGHISPPSVMIEIPHVCIDEAIRAMVDAHSILRESRPSTWSPSLTEQRLHYAIEELKQCMNQ